MAQITAEARHMTEMLERMEAQTNEHIMALEKPLRHGERADCHDLHIAETIRHAQELIDDLTPLAGAAALPDLKG